MSDPEKFLSGAALYGDDLSADQIAAWYSDEKEATFDLSGNYAYNHHGLSWYHGWRHLPRRSFRHLLSFGGSSGIELRDILARIKNVTVLEPSEQYKNPRFRYVQPDPGGILPFADNSFDALTCFGVLHHIPNVSKVIGEFYRVLEPGGFVLIREPIVSMGDWRFPRAGLTKHERGIPLSFFDQVVKPFDVVHRGKCLFRPVRYFFDSSYNSKAVAALDAWICKLPWPQIYHAQRTWQKFGPVSITYVLKKPYASPPQLDPETAQPTAGDYK